MIIGDALVLKIANSMSLLPDGYLDLQQALPFTVPTMDTNEDVIEMDRYDFTQLNDYLPFGTLNVFLRDYKDGTVMRLPHSMPKITIVPGKELKEKERELKPEKSESLRPNNVETNHGSGSEISLGF